MPKTDPHPWNGSMIKCKQEYQRSAKLMARDVDDDRHAVAMRKIDDLKFQKSLQSEIDELEL